MNYSDKYRAIRKTVTYTVFLICLPVWLVDIAIHPNRLIIKRIEFSVTSSCTLKCRDCANLMQYYRRAGKTYAIEPDVLLADITKILSMADYYAAVSVVGGEPFIYPHLSGVLKALTESGKVGRIMVTTNGTVLPHDEALQLMKNKKVVVRITRYPHEVTSSPDKTYDYLKEKGVAVFMEIPKWREPFGAKGLEPRGRSDSVLAMNFRNCRKCIELVDGKIHCCPVSAHGMYLGLITPDAGDYADIRSGDIETCREKLKQFDRPPRDFFVRACDHCDTGMPDVPRIPPAIQDS